MTKVVVHSDEPRRDPHQELIARVAANVAEFATVRATGGEARTRSMAWQTETALLVCTIMERFEVGGETRAWLLEEFDAQGLPHPTGPEAETRAARFAGGPGPNAEQRYRIANAVREVRASGTNDPRAYLARHGGASGCHRLWLDRKAAGGGTACDSHTGRARSKPARLELPAGLDGWMQHTRRIAVDCVLIRDPKDGTWRMGYVAEPRLALVEAMDAVFATGTDTKPGLVPLKRVPGGERLVLADAKLADFTRAGMIRTTAVGDEAGDTALRKAKTVSAGDLQGGPDASAKRPESPPGEAESPADREGRA